MNLRALCAPLLAGLLAVSATGCDGGGEAAGTPTPGGPVRGGLDWDLSKGHTTKNVRWPNKLSAFEMSGGVRVRLTLPAGRSFDGRVERVMGRREDETVRNLDLFYKATTTEDAYAQAKRLGAQWAVDLRNIDAWYQRRMEQRRKGREDLSDTAFTGDPHSRPLGGPDGPAPAIEVLNSFDDKRPVVVNLSFVWPRQG
ncbi:hypothetical protein [Actinomadura craniellae]|nr:hypothetical protein [Actinomadura craniellae]